MIARVLRPTAALSVVLALLCAACVGPFARPEGYTVDALLERSNNLFVGSEVRVLGVKIGTVDALEQAGTDVRVTLRIDDPDRRLPADVAAVVSPTSLLGERFVQLDPPYVEGPVLEPGATIPKQRTVVPAEVDEVLDSFDRFLRGLDPDALADLVAVLAETLRGQGEGLNQLLDQGADTVRVLADASGDLNRVVSNLAELNSTLAVRDERIGQVLEDWTTVAETLAGESDTIISGLANLRRLTAELRPLIDDHADPLVRDLEEITTALSTTERNLERVGTLILGGRRLFEGAGRAVEFPEARLKLDNEGEFLSVALTERIAQRLAGVCIRLGLPECALPAFWRAHLPALLCLEGLVACTPDKATLAKAIAAALRLLPADAVAQLGDPGEAGHGQNETAQTGQAGPGPAREPGLLEGLPLPDPRLELEDAGPPRFRDRMAGWLGGR